MQRTCSVRLVDHWLHNATSGVDEPGRVLEDQWTVVVGDGLSDSNGAVPVRTKHQSASLSQAHVENALQILVSKLSASFHTYLPLEISTNQPIDCLKATNLSSKYLAREPVIILALMTRGSLRLLISLHSATAADESFTYGD